MNTKDYLTIGELAASFGWSTRFVDGLVKGEKIPGLQINGQWRFRRSELVDWLGQKIQTLDAAHIAEIELNLASGAESTRQGPTLDRLTVHLTARGIGLDRDSMDKIDTIRQLLDLGEATGAVLNRESLYAAVLEREALCSTAISHGVAICHPRRPRPLAVQDTLLVFLRNTRPIPFGALDGSRTDLHFLLCAPDDASHLQALARLARILDAQVLTGLRRAATPEEVLRLLEDRETALLTGQTPSPRS